MRIIGRAANVVTTRLTTLWRRLSANVLTLLRRLVLMLVLVRLALQELPINVVLLTTVTGVVVVCDLR